MTRHHGVRYCRTCGVRLARDNDLTDCAPCQRRTGELRHSPPEVPSDFWTTTLMADAFALWHIGQVIRAYRHHRFHGPRPLSQELVAHWLGLTQTQLSRVESGLPVKDLDKLITWAQTLKFPPGMLWFKLPGDQEQARHREPPASHDPSAAFPALADAATVAPANSGGADLLAMQSFRAADRQVGGGHLYATVVNYLHAALAPRIFGAVDSKRQPSIFTAASALTEMAGWMAHDAGRDELAARHFQRSLDLAMAGDDDQLTAHIMGSMSHLALHRREPAKAIGLARQGQRVLATAPPHPGLAARLLAMEARGLSALPVPESATCGKVLLSAERVLDDDQPEPSSPWISCFDEGSLASEAARCMRQLGQLKAAARQARRIIEIRPSTHARSRAFGQLLLAGVLVAQGEPEQACAFAQQALDATRSVSSYLVVQQLGELTRLLEPYQANQVVGAYLAGASDELRQRSWLYSSLTTSGSADGTLARAAG